MLSLGEAARRHARGWEVHGSLSTTPTRPVQRLGSLVGIPACHSGRTTKAGPSLILPQALKADGTSRFILVVCPRGQERKGDEVPVSQLGFHGVDSDRDGYSDLLGWWSQKACKEIGSETGKEDNYENSCPPCLEEPSVQPPLPQPPAVG